MKEQKTKGLKLLPRILGAIVIPLVVMVVFAALAIRAVGVDMADRLTESQLASSVVGMRACLEAASTGAYRMEGDSLWKGEMNLTQQPIALDAFRDETDTEITLFVDDTRLATSIMDDTGARILHTTMDPKVYQALQSSSTYFSNDANVNGEPFYGYYQVIEQMDGKNLILFAGKESGDIQAIYMRSLRSNLIFIVVLAVIVCMIIATMSRRIVKVILNSASELNQVAVGDLTVKVDQTTLKRGDELGTIGRAIHMLITKLCEILIHIHESSEHLQKYSGKLATNFGDVNYSIENINTAVNEIATGATNQANETQHVTEQMVVMGNSVSTTTKSVENLIKNTEEMKQYNEKVAETLDQLIEISDKSAASVENVYTQTNVTNQSAQEIRSAIDIISDIASQTNLLSLNASIEAARAGEHGKGFAVVAEEVRKLADQSKEAVGKIEDIVNQLIQNSDTSVSIMGSMMGDIEEQGQKLADTKGVFGGLNSNILEVVEEIDKISREIEAIEEAKNQVLGNLENLAAISEENAASTEETSATMSEVSRIMKECGDAVVLMETLSKELAGHVSRFELPQQEASETEPAEPDVTK